MSHPPCAERSPGNCCSGAGGQKSRTAAGSPWAPWHASPGSSAPFLQAGPAPSSARPLHPHGIPPPLREAFLCQQPLFSPAVPGYGQHDQGWTSQPLLPSHSSLATGGFGMCHFAPGAANISRQPSLAAAGKQQAPDRERESSGSGAGRPKHKAPASLRSARRLLPEQAASLGPAPLLRGMPRSALPLQGILIAWLNLQGRQPGLREHGLLWKGKQNRARVKLGWRGGGDGVGPIALARRSRCPGQGAGAASPAP